MQSDSGGDRQHRDELRRLKCGVEWTTLVLMRGRPSRVLVMDLLGPSLEDMSWAVSAGGPLSATTTLMVADQALARIAAVHRAGVVHRDVKPDNLLLGNPSNRGGARTVHLVDFGLAVPGPDHPAAAAAISSANSWSGGASTEGTARYSSAAADAGRLPTYADDLEALVFSLSYLRAGTTPWVPPELRGDVHEVLRAKATVTEDSLAVDGEDAKWLWALLTHARELRWGCQIDLAYCRGVVQRAFGAASGGLPMREVSFEWEDETIHRELCSSGMSTL